MTESICILILYNLFSDYSLLLLVQKLRNLASVKRNFIGFKWKKYKLCTMYFQIEKWNFHNIYYHSMNDSQLMPVTRTKIITFHSVFFGFLFQLTSQFNFLFICLFKFAWHFVSVQQFQNWAQCSINNCSK